MNSWASRIFANSNAKFCREYKQEGGQRVEVTGSTRFHKTLWNKIGSNRTSYYIVGLIHSVFAGSPTVSQFCDLETQIKTMYYYITEVYRLNTMVGIVRYLITLLKYTLFYYIVELYPMKITLLSYTQS